MSSAYYSKVPRISCTRMMDAGAGFGMLSASSAYYSVTKYTGLFHACGACCGLVDNEYWNVCNAFFM